MNKNYHASLAAAVGVTLAVSCFADAASTNASETVASAANTNTAVGAAFNLGELTVTANRIGLTAREVPADTSVVNREATTAFGHKEVIDALREVPGVQLTHRYETGGMSGGITLRGMSYNNTSGGNVLTLLDGVPQRRLSLGGPYWGCLPHAAVTSMELVKGNLATQYGRGGMLGVLSMTTDPEDPNTRWGELEGAFDTRSVGFRETFRYNEPIDELHGGYAYVTADNAHGNGWCGGNHGYVDTHVYFNAGLQASERDFFQLFGGYMHGDWKYNTPVVVNPYTGDLAPYMSRDSSFDIFNNFGNVVDEYRVSGRWRHDFDDDLQFQFTSSLWAGDTDSGVNRPTSVTSYSMQNPVLSGINMIDSTQQELGWFNEALLTKKYEFTDWLTGSITGGGTFEKWWSEKKQWNYGSGMTYNVVTHAITGADKINWAVSPSHTGMDLYYYGLFLMNNWKITKYFDFQYGLREEWQDFGQDDFANKLSDRVLTSYFTPSVGGVVHVYDDGSNLADVYSNWGRNYNPNTRTGFTQTSMCDLTPEYNETFEYGLRTSFMNGLFGIKTAGYHIRRRDVAELINGAYVHSQDQSIDGWEIGLEVRPVDDLRLYANYTGLRSEVTKCDSNPQRVGTDIMFTPNNLATFGAAYRPEQGFGASAQVSYTGECFGGYYNNVRCPGYWLTDVAVSYRWRGWEATLFVDNLFDTEYYADYFSDNNNWFFVGTPCSIGVKLKYRF